MKSRLYKTPIEPLPYVVYMLALNKVSIKNLLDLYRSTQFIEVDVKTRSGLTLPFIGHEKDYAKYLIDTELMYYYLSGNLTPYAKTLGPTHQDIFVFLNKYTIIDRIGLFKRLFRLFGGG